MTSPPFPTPSAASALRVETWPEPELDRYRDLFRRVGSRWLWYSRLVMSEAELRAAIAEVHVVRDSAGAEVGLIELEFALPVCRLRFLGLVPEMTGRGHGRWLLGEALRLAWRDGVERVELFTCSLDHPAAMPTYLGAGFVATGRTFESFPDPRLIGLLPRDCAPQVPLVEPS